MPVYVDQPMTFNDRFKDYCHLYADTVEELHAMAAKLGLRRSWFQDKLDHPHYDLAPSKRVQAVRLGAVETDMKHTAAWIQGNRAKRLAQPEVIQVCRVVSHGHCDQCDHPCKEYFER